MFDSPTSALCPDSTMTVPTRAWACCALALAGCGSLPPTTPAAGHLRSESAVATPGRIPPPVQQAPLLAKPRPAARTETYSVVVNNVPVAELLFALARDARLNVDIHPGIAGSVTLNAIDQTLPQLLNRIAKQADMRYELDGPNLVVMPDTPFLRTYRVDYVNMARDVTGSVSTNTQIATTGAAGGSGTGAPTLAGGGNSSTTEVRNLTRNRFWESLERNIRDLLRETDKILPEGSSETVVERTETQSSTGTAAPPATGRPRDTKPPPVASSPNPVTVEDSGRTVTRRVTFREAASVIVNAETGVVTVRASARQHEKVQEFLDHVLASARRQVLVEATIAEVSLSDNYQQGIDWQYLRDKGSQVAIGQGATTQRVLPDGSFESIASTLPSAVANTIFTAAFGNGGFTAVIRLLEAFGNVKILSSPKLSVLNNQTALLKVVDNRVFFTVEATETTITSGGTVVPPTITAKPNTVAVGLVMSVTPQIGAADNITLNVRPTITRVTNQVLDPTPALAVARVQNLVPEIQTREMESVMRLANGEIAVLGGLMQDELDYRDDTVPGLARLPVVGPLFQYRNDTSRKTELVIFLRPTIIRDPSIRGDYRVLRDALPRDDFLTQDIGPRQPHLSLPGDPRP
jgi:general secretion pathway protein D